MSISDEKTTMKSSCNRNFNSSQENLLKECGNHLQLGQWELFRATIRTLLKSNERSKRDEILSLLQSLYNRPHEHSHGSNKISNPFNLFWLCANLHQEITENHAQEDVLLRDAAFRHLLGEVLPLTSQHFVKELYAFYRFLASSDEQRNDSATVTLSTECRRSIRELLKTSPELGVSVLESLIVTERQRSTENSLTLLRILYYGIDYEISLLETRGGGGGSWSTVSSFEEDRTSSNAFRLLLRIADALLTPMRNVDSEWNEVECHLREVEELVNRLWHLCERDASHKHVVLDCLLCQPNLLLLRMFYKVDNRIRNRIEGGKANRASMAEKFLRLAYDRHGNFDIKEMYLFSVVNECHFLEMLVFSCIELIGSGEHLLARSILCSQAFFRLKGFVFLSSWSKIKSASDAIRIIDAFESMRDETNDGDIQLMDSCNRLIQKAKLVLGSLESKSVRRCLNNQRNIVDIMSSLQSRSALNILHNCYHLNQLEREKAYEELTRCTKGDEKAYGRPLLSGFYLLYDLLNVVLASTKVDQLIDSKDSQNRHRKLSRDSQNGTCINLEEIKVYYEENVTKPLEKIRDSINDLYPLCFRIEVLENAFSFLFLMHRDMKTGSRGCSSSSSSSNTDEERHDEDEGTESKMFITDKIGSLSRSLDSDDTVNDDRRHGRCKKSRLKSSSRQYLPLSSENAGSLSTSSSASGRPAQVGFLLNEYVVRDVLDCLQRCVLATTFFIDGHVEMELNENDGTFVPCSVPERMASQRAARLSQYVSEAIWRLQLATDGCISKEVGVSPLEDQEALASQMKTDDMTWRFYNFQEEDEDSEDGVVESQKGVKSQSRSPRHSVLLRTPIPLRNESSRIIPKMLSQHDTLLNLCLQQNDLIKAAQVIKMFGLESSEKAIEVEFATHYEEAVRRLSRTSASLAYQHKSTRKVNSSVTMLSEQRQSAWNSIVEAAQAGADAAETMIADELLASHKIPCLLEVNESGTMSQWLPSPIDWRGLVRGDLAVVACRRIPACRNLLEASYATLSRGACQISNRSTGRSSKSATPTKGILGFLENVTLLVSFEAFSEQDAKENQLLKCVFRSKAAAVRDVLLSGMWPLSSKAHKKVFETWQHLAATLERLERYLQSECTQSGEHRDSASTTFHGTSKSKTSRPSRHPIHVHFRKLQQISAAMHSFLDEQEYISVPCGSHSNECVPTPAYLATLYDYSKRLSAILPQFSSEIIQTQQGSYFSVFHQSPLTILESLLFDDSISPSELENFAKQLGLDLVQVIIKQCCPPIPATYSDCGQLQSIIENEDQKETKKIDRDETTSQSFHKMSIRHLKFIEERCSLAAVLVQALGCAVALAVDGEAVECAVVLHPVLHRLLEYRGAGADIQKVPFALTSCASMDSIRTTFELLHAQENWSKALEYLESWECRSPLTWDMVGLLRDLVLSHLVTDRRNSSVSPWLFVSRIHDITLRSKLVLEHFWNWSADGALAAFDVCLSREDLDPSIRSELKCHQQKIQLYSTICNKILKGDIPWTSEFFNCTWQLVSKLSNSDPSALLTQLFDAECYDLILVWSRLHSVTETLKQVVDESYLLDVSSSDRTTIQKVLGRITDPQRRVFICERLLNRSHKLHSEAIVLQLMMGMENFAGHCNNEVTQVTHHKIGAKILLCFSEDERSEYLSLVSHPHFMIEQMLIDIKIEPLERAFQLIREDLRALSETSPLSFAALNTLLEIYAFKAVDFRVVQTLSTDHLAVTAPGGMGSTSDKKPPFIVPMSVPSKEQWVPDAIVMNCMVCSTERFSMFNRRHHCRRCGRVVCGNCSQQNIHVDGYGDIEVRVCDDCYDHGSDSSSSEMHHLEHRLKARITGSSVGDGKERTTFLKREPSSESEHSRRSIWKLSTDETHNHTAREEFSYEQAPNISLCLSILDLHWDQHRSGLYILELADNMFRLLQPIEPGKPNPEIDYNLVINMLKSVLLSAKVKFSRSCDSDGVNRCDLYLGLADLLKLLVVANCKDLIPVGDLTQNDVFRRLRDKLILNERWALALDISTKGGLEVIGVWSAWGMACLRIGRYAAAREKFSLCFQRLKDQNKVTQTNALLQQILNQLETSKIVPIDDKSAVVTTSLQCLRNIRQGNIKDRSANLESKNMESFVRNECSYYIETFGTQATHLSFYVQNNLWEDALRYTLEKKCIVPLFIDEIAMPSLRKGRFLKVLKEMKSTQSSFEKWTPYLGPLCRHLERHDHIHSLYNLQIFMKDHVRAAMTCILFYRRGIRDYFELYDRLPHLAQAKQHLKLYETQLAGSTFGTTRHTLGMAMPVDEVQRYLRSITMQTEVTNFLYEKIRFGRSISFSEASEVSSIYSASSSRATTPEKQPETNVPTLFDDSKARAHLVTAVILAGNTLGEGFLLANRIVREFKLHVGKVYGLVARKLVQSDRIEDVSVLVSCLTGSISTDICDEVVLKAIAAVLTSEPDGNEVDSLIRLLKNDRNKIDAFVSCGKLKSAYLLAVKEHSVETVLRIKEEAERINQPSVKALCIKWLNLKQKK